MIYAFVLFSALLIYLIFDRRRRQDISRLGLLLEYKEQEVDWDLSKDRLKLLGDRFGKAGLYSQNSRNIFYIAISFVFLFFCVAFYQLGAIIFVSIFLSLYLTAMIGLMYLRVRANDLERETLFRLPLFLESVILLVESGLGVLPAVQSVVLASKNKNEPVAQMMQAVYELSSSGLPFSQALELVANSIDNKPLRHVLLHLDVSSSEGGALIPSLRSLAEYAHREWKLSVESRVKKLENAVVFPVFAAVIGLMLLVVAVPVVPVVDFFSSLGKQNRFEAVNTRVGVFK